MNNIQKSSDFFIQNRALLMDNLPENSVVIISANDFIPKSADQTYPFCQNKDFFYLTGLNQEKSVLCLCKSHPNPDMREVIFLLNASPDMEIWTGHRYTKEEVAQISGLKTIFLLEDFDMIMKEVMIISERVFLWQNESPKFITEYPTANDLLVKKIQSNYPLHRFERLTPVLAGMRLKKQQQEIIWTNQAIEITKKALLKAMHTITPGLMEYQVAAELTREILWNGASGHAFEPIVASGENACVLHYVTLNDTLNKEDLVLMDFGAEYNYYASDCSRTLPVDGTFSKRQKQCYNAVLGVFKKARKLYIPGNTIHGINQQANRWMEEEMITLGLFSKQDIKNQDPANPLFKKYFMHGTAHFAGLDVHDYGLRHYPLEKGMVLTCEPGLYIQEEKMGIRIENMILVDDQPIDLMEKFPIEIRDIEKIMKKTHD